MAPRRNGRATEPIRPPTRPGARAQAADDEDDFQETEEVLEIHSVADSSEVATPSSGGGGSTLPARSRSRKTPISISSTSVPASRDGEAMEEHNEEMEDLEEVDVSANVDGDEEMEEVDLEGDPPGDHLEEYETAYLTGSQDAAATQQDSAAPVYHDGKGQHKGVQITMQAVQKAQTAAKKSKASIITPRDRADRITAHKLHVLSLLAFAKRRNKLLDNDDVRDELINAIPARFTTKLRAIKPKKVASVTERVRMTEDLVDEMTRWWRGRFKLDRLKVVMNALRQPNADVLAGHVPVPGAIIDGWEVESAAERDERQKEERKARAKWVKQTEMAAAARVEADSKGKGKGKARDVGQGDDDLMSAIAARNSASQPPKQTEICLFAPGSTQPIYMRLLAPTEAIVTHSDMVEAARQLSGSRELSAQLFVALCRTIGLPARLVISLQVVPWSISASKVSMTSTKPAPPPVARGKRSAVLAKLAPSREKQQPRQHYHVEAAAVPDVLGDDLPEDGSTSDEENFVPPAGVSLDSPADVDVTVSRKGSRRKPIRTVKPHPRTRGGSATAPITVDDDSNDEDIDSAAPSVDGSTTARRSTKAGASNGTKRSRGQKETAEAADEASSSKNWKGNGKGRVLGADEEKPDNRPEKWRGLQTALEVEHKPRLRAHRTKTREAHEVALDDMSDVEAVDLRSPPTMWVEVYNKPLKKWMTVDPIRGEVHSTGNRHMEPSASDRSNKLVYVVAFEEDGTGRDVTARYTRTLATRIARMRPPAAKRSEATDWWATVVRAIDRKTPLDRDAEEDVELEDFASRESLPTSVGAFKDHPVYVLEKHLLRDEVLFPPTRVGTFQGGPVFSRKNVVKVRSARQWYNEGRVVREGQTALKRVKARGFTLESKRATEQAKAEGAEGVMEGLYAEFQTELYEAPPVVDGIVPKNAYGNIDLFVPSMLPKGAVHLPYSGTAKVAAKLGISYAEATVGFEFRKQRSHPKMAGIVIPEEHEDVVTEAYWASAEAAAQREFDKKQERALRNWKKLLNALRIAKRLRDEYGAKSAAVLAATAKAEPLREGPSRLRRDDAAHDVMETRSNGAAEGGFMPDAPEDGEQARVGPLPSYLGQNRTHPSRREDDAGSSSDSEGSGSRQDEVHGRPAPQSIFPPPLRRSTARLPVAAPAQPAPVSVTNGRAVSKRVSSTNGASAPATSRRTSARTARPSRKRARGGENEDDSDSDNDEGEEPEPSSSATPQRRSTRARAVGKRKSYAEAELDDDDDEDVRMDAEADEGETPDAVPTPKRRRFVVTRK